MAIKTINYVVSVDGITPTSQQFGGTQGDHRVTELRFSLDGSLRSAILTAAGDNTVLYRFDAYDGSGGMRSTEPMPLGDDPCVFALEEWQTRFGGNVQVYLVITEVADGTEMELYSFPAVLRLKDRPDGHSVDGNNYESISTLYEGAKKSAEVAEDAAGRAEQALDDLGGAIPDIDVTEVSDGVEITVTDKEGINTAKVYNGRNGKDGQNGKDGNDGADGKDGKDGKDVDYSLVANALKGNASGGVVAIKDVSPLEHNVKVILSGDLPEADEVLTKTETVSTKGATVMLNTPAESVRVVVSGGAYCVGGLVPTVDGDDLTVSGVREQLVLWPAWAYVEAPGNYDLVYTISGNTLSWSGSKYYEFEGVINQSEAVSGSVELSTSGQKITGFCQVYGLDEDNPVAQHPKYDELNMTVEVYEGSASSVNLSVYGKNLVNDSLKSGTPPNIFFDTKNYTTKHATLKAGTYTLSAKVKDGVGGTTYLYVMDADNKYTTLYSKAGSSLTFTLTETKTVNFKAYNTNFKAIDDLVWAQLEVGGFATEYEPYIAPVTYPVNADGTVSGVELIRPSMTFVPDTDGVNIEVEYNRDINKAFAELQNALISLGGNV